MTKVRNKHMQHRDLVDPKATSDGMTKGRTRFLLALPGGDLTVFLIDSLGPLFITSPDLIHCFTRVFYDQRTQFWEEFSPP